MKSIVRKLGLFFVVVLFIAHSGSPATVSAQTGTAAEVTDSEKTSAPVKEYKIGDVGPAGGLVFYDKGNNQDGWRYLEAAPQDAGKAKWSKGGNPLSRTSTEPGMGKWNTNYIERYLQANGESDCAAQLCLSYTQGGYSDWFLPSKDELNLMYKNLEQKDLGGFSLLDWYWSSSQSYDSNAWCQRFSDGYQVGNHYDSGKTDSNSVRAARAF